MINYTYTFATSGDVQSALDERTLGKPYVAYVEDGQYIDWNSKSIDYRNFYLTLEVVSAGTLNTTVNNNTYAYVAYSVNGGEWIEIERQSATVNWGTFNVGDTIRLKAHQIFNSDMYYQELGGTAKCKLSGNVYSICVGDDFKTGTTKGNVALKLGNVIVGDFSNVVITKNCDCYYLCLNMNSITKFNPIYVDDEVYSIMSISDNNNITEVYLPSKVTSKKLNSAVLYNCRNCNYINWPLDINDGYTKNSYFNNYFGKQLASAGTFVRKDGVDWGTFIPSGWTVEPPMPPQPSYIGEWSGYTFTINDSGATAWENPVEIATIPTAYIQGDECSVSVTLRFEYDEWWLKFEAEGQSAFDEFELDPALTYELDTEYVKLNSSASESDDASVHIRFDESNNKNIISFSSTDDNIQPLVMTTINIEEE